MSSYKRAYEYKSKYPTKALFYMSKVIGTKNYKNNMNQLSDAIV